MRIRQSRARQVSHDRGNVLVRNTTHPESGRQCCFVAEHCRKADSMTQKTKATWFEKLADLAGRRTKAPDNVVSGRC